MTKRIRTEAELIEFFRVFLSWDFPISTDTHDGFYLSRPQPCIINSFNLSFRSERSMLRPMKNCLNSKFVVQLSVTDLPRFSPVAAASPLISSWYGCGMTDSSSS